MEQTGLDWVGLVKLLMVHNIIGCMHEVRRRADESGRSNYRRGWPGLSIYKVVS